MYRALVLAAALLVSPSSVAPATPLPLVTMSATAPTQSIPADTTDYAKFPHDKREVIDALEAVNSLVNDGIQPESDKDHYGVEDLWVMLPPDDKGDCEDYALTKIFYLEQIGVSPASQMKLVGVVVHVGKQREGHAILAVLLPSGDVAYLDNLRPNLATRAELVASGYQFFDWRA